MISFPKCGSAADVQGTKKISEELDYTNQRWGIYVTLCNLFFFSASFWVPE